MVIPVAPKTEEFREPSGREPPHGPLILRIRWAGAENQPGVQFAMAAVSLLFDALDELRTVDADGGEFDDLELDECLAILQKGRAAAVTGELAQDHIVLGNDWTLRFAQNNRSESPAIDVEINVERRTWEMTPSQCRYLDMHWLQTRLEFKAPLPLLAVPVDREGIVPAALHGLVGLASRCGQLESAEAVLLEPGSSRTLARWHAKLPPVSGSRLVYPVAGTNDETLWIAHESTGDVSKAIAWVEYPDGLDLKPQQEPSADQIRLSIESIIDHEPIDFSKLNECIWRLLPDARIVRFAPLSDVLFPRFMSQPQEGLISVIAPKPATVQVGLSGELDSQLFVDTVLHAVGHILLGHVRPADEYGHWDTTDTIRGVGTQRRWDGQVADIFADWLQKPGGRVVDSLDGCTPHEKACLGLWRMIGETQGGGHRDERPSYHSPQCGL
jgi:hypothetical protein